MAVRQPKEEKSPFVDKDWIRKKLAEVWPAPSVQLDPSLTAQQAREMMIADGIRPEDNEFTREMIRLRYNEES